MCFSQWLVWSYIGNTKLTEMKHVLTLMALVVAVTAGAQGTSIHEYPWNPDSNNDNLIGVDDLLDFLPVFGDEFGNPPEPCDYDGTPLEELMAGIINGDIILDSIFVEYQLEDVSTYYIAGCPDTITDTLILSNTAMLIGFDLMANGWAITGYDAYGVYARFGIEFNATDGLYRLLLRSDFLHSAGFLNDGYFGGSYSSNTVFEAIPFPEEWYLDEEGIHIESGWDEFDWPYYANYLHILPYWHYAE